MQNPEFAEGTVLELSFI